jgi:hypothetical protein
LCASISNTRLFDTVADEGRRNLRPLATFRLIEDQVEDIVSPWGHRHLMLSRRGGFHTKQQTTIHIVVRAARDVTWVRIIAKQMVVPWSSWFRMACSSELFWDQKRHKRALPDYTSHILCYPLNSLRGQHLLAHLQQVACHRRCCIWYSRPDQDSTIAHCVCVN